MQSYCLELTEQMAIRKEDQAWIAEEIRAAIQKHLSPHGWRKLQDFLPLAAVLGVFVGLLALAGAGWNYAFSRVATEAQFQAHTTDALKLTADRLTRIEGKLGILQAQTAATKFSTIPVKELKKHREELADVKKNLASLAPDTPNYWPASFQIINLLSLATSYIESSNHTESTVENSGGIHVEKNGDTVVLKGLIRDSTFEDSVIRFDPNVRLANVTFINCVFIFPASQNPSKPLQDIGKTLLASDLSKVTLNAS